MYKSYGVESGTDDMGRKEKLTADDIEIVVFVKRLFDSIVEF